MKKQLKRKIVTAEKLPRKLRERLQKERIELRAKAENTATVKARGALEKKDIIRSLEAWFNNYGKEGASFDKLLVRVHEYMQTAEARRPSPSSVECNHIAGRVDKLKESIREILEDNEKRKRAIFDTLRDCMEESRQTLTGEAALVMAKANELLIWEPAQFEQMLSAFVNACDSLPKEYSARNGRPVDENALFFLAFWKNRFNEFTTAKLSASEEGAFAEFADIIANISEKKIRGAIDKLMPKLTTKKQA